MFRFRFFIQAKHDLFATKGAQHRGAALFAGDESMPGGLQVVEPAFEDCLDLQAAGGDVQRVERRRGRVREVAVVSAIGHVDGQQGA